MTSNRPGDEEFEKRWWWKGSPDPVELVDGALVRIECETAFWYELEARGIGWDKNCMPKYRLGVPFVQLKLKQVLELEKYYPVPPGQPGPLGILSTAEAEQFEVRLDDYYLFRPNLRDFPDGAIIDKFREWLAQIREERGIPSPKFKRGRRHRIARTGRSFRPIEAMDIMRFSQDRALKNKVRRDHARATKLLKDLRQFTR